MSKPSLWAALLVPVKLVRAPVALELEFQSRNVLHQQDHRVGDQGRFQKTVHFHSPLLPAGLPVLSLVLAHRPSDEVPDYDDCDSDRDCERDLLYRHWVHPLAEVLRKRQILPGQVNEVLTVKTFFTP